MQTVLRFIRRRKISDFKSELTFLIGVSIVAVFDDEFWSSTLMKFLFVAIFSGMFVFRLIEVWKQDNIKSPNNMTGNSNRSDSVEGE
jgi:hypothetical protein